MTKNIYKISSIILIFLFLVFIGPIIAFILYKSNSNKNLINNKYQEFVNIFRNYISEVKYDYEKNYDYEIKIEEYVQNPIIWNEFFNFGDDWNDFLNNITNYINGSESNQLGFIDENDEYHTINNLDYKNIGKYYQEIEFYYYGRTLNENFEESDYNFEELIFTYRFSIFDFNFNNEKNENVVEKIEILSENEDGKIGQLYVKKNQKAKVILEYNSNSKILNIKEYSDYDNDKTNFDEANIKFFDSFEFNILRNFLFLNFWINDGTYNESFLENNFGARITVDKVIKNWKRKNGTWTYDWVDINSNQEVNTSNGLRTGDEFLKGSRQFFSFMIMGTKFEENITKKISEIVENAGNYVYNGINLISYFLLLIILTFVTLLISILILLIYIFYKKEIKN